MLSAERAGGYDAALFRDGPRTIENASIQLGSFQLKSVYALAPMAGATDVPFRALAWRYGAGYMVSEMVSDKAELWETGKSRLRRVPVPGVVPNAVQIAGTAPAQLADAARRHVDAGAQVIDLNFGCPVKKVLKKNAGSALLADLKLVEAIIGAVRSAVSVPITVKTRTGLEPGDGRGLEAARIAEGEGASMVIMHARSRHCRFRGAVDYEAVRPVAEALSIPVLVNGDVHDAASARRAISLSCASGVMIGRAALGRPWLFRELNQLDAPTRMEKWRVIIEHVGDMHDFYGEKTGVRIARKHVQAYLEEMDCSSHVASFMRLAEAEAQLDRLRALSNSCARAIIEGSTGDSQTEAIR